MDKQALPPHPSGGPDGRELSPRELLILQLVARGYTLPHLSNLLRESVETLEALTRRTTRMLEVRTFKEAVSKAKSLGLIV